MDQRAIFAKVAIDDDSQLGADNLTPKRDQFARVWAETGNQAAAYRTAYNVAERTLPSTVWAAASRIAALPCVRAAYKKYYEQATLDTIVTIREALQWQLDIATADPNEIVRVVARCCRHCYGHGHKYQWRDESEYMEECVKAIDVQKSPPLSDGGFGYNGGLEPVLSCTHCYGAGIEQTIVSDTTKLTGKARKLYAGAEQDRFGAIKVKMHDQGAAWERVCRMLGAFNDKLDLRTPEELAKDQTRNKLPENVTAETAAKAYLQMIGGGK